MAEGYPGLLGEVLKEVERHPILPDGPYYATLKQLEDAVKETSAEVEKVSIIVGNVNTSADKAAEDAKKAESCRIAAENAACEAASMIENAKDKVNGYANENLASYDKTLQEAEMAVMKRIADEIDIGIDAAEDAADRAKRSAELAEMAVNEAKYVYFEVNGDGELILIKTDNTDLVFRLTETGCMEVTYES